MKLKIRQPELSPRTCQVWLDDKEITSDLTGFTVSFATDDVTTAELRVTIDDLDVDAQTVAILQAHVDAQRPT